MPPPDLPPMTLATVLSSSSAGTPARALFQAHTDPSIVSAIPVTSTLPPSGQSSQGDISGSQVLGTVTQPTVTVGYSQDVTNSQNSIRDDISVHSQESSSSSVIVTRQVAPHQLLQDDDEEAQFSDDGSDHVPSGQGDPEDIRTEDQPFVELDSNVPSIYDSLTEEEHQPPASIPEQAMAIDYAELLHLVAQRSGFTVGDQFVARSRSTLRMGAQFVPESTPSRFVALSASQNVLNCSVQARLAAAQATNATQPGLPPPAFFKANTKQYAFTSDDLRLPACSHPDRDLPNWLVPVQPRHRIYVRDMDLSQLEALTRETLAACSYLDAMQTACSNIATELNHPLLLRIIMASGGLLLDVTNRAAFALQLLTTHRRDAALFRTRKLLLPEQLSELRNAPCLASRSLFDPELVRRINTEHLATARDSLISRAYLNPMSFNQNAQGGQHYRDSEQGTSRPNKRQRSNKGQQDNASASSHNQQRRAPQNRNNGQHNNNGQRHQGQHNQNGQRSSAPPASQNR